MDNLMKRVPTALERSYLARETEVKAERLKSAAELLVLHHDTLKLIDGAGPSVEAPQTVPEKRGNDSRTELEQEAAKADHEPHKTETVVTVGTQGQTVKTPKCTFPGEVSIDLKRFADSGIALVECASLFENAFALPKQGCPPVPTAR